VSNFLSLSLSLSLLVQFSFSLAGAFAHPHLTSNPDLRHESEPITLWADAVCINQRDDAEKSLQVVQMGRVYSAAESVVVWLGEEQDDCHLIAESFIAARGRDGPPYFPPEWGGGMLEADRLMQAAAKFLRRQWWGRLWVIQEVLLARELEFCFGRWRFEEPDVWLGLAGFVIMLLGGEAQIGGSEREGISRSLMTIGRLGGMRARRKKEKGLFRFEESEQSGTVRDQDGRQESADPSEGETDDGDSKEVVYDISALDPIQNYTLLSLLESFSERQCSLPEDQIFGLLGLADDADKYPAPDYSKPAEEVFIKVALRNLQDQERGGLSFLCFAGTGPKTTGSDGRRRRLLQLPSWVPDWTSRRYNCLASRHIHLSTKLQPEPKFHLSSDLKTLCVHGAVFDTVASITSIDVTAEGPHLSPDRFFANGEPLWYHRTGTTRLQAVLRTLVYDVNVASNKLLVPGTKSMSSIASGFLYSLGQGLGEEDMASSGEGGNETTTTTTTPDYINCFLRWLREERRGRSDAQIRELFTGKQDSGLQTTKWKEIKDELTRGKDNYQMLYSPSRMFINSLSGGHLLETQNGLFGMSSGMAQKGDVICILFGCPMPIILRRMGENWRIIQSCYIHGMDEDVSLLQAQEFSIV